MNSQNEIIFEQLLFHIKMFKQAGGNTTDITQMDALKLIVKYWSSLNINHIETPYCFVGDIHADFNQFLAPLICTGLIKLTGKIILFSQDNSEYPEANIYIPEYTINSECKTKIMFLGDLVDEWIFSRNIVCMLYKLLAHDKLTNNIFYCFGNHDLSIVGKYNVFKQYMSQKKCFDVFTNLPNVWIAMKRELSGSANVKIECNKLFYKTNNEFKENDLFVNSYLSLYFEVMYELYCKYGKFAYVAYLNKSPFIISHTTWTPIAIEHYLKNIPRKVQKRTSNILETEPITNSANQDIKPFESVLDSLNDLNKQIEFPANEYNSLVSLINTFKLSRTNEYVSANELTYTRNNNNVFVSQIVGHSAGGAFRDLDVNSEFATYNNERINKLKPVIKNNCKIYYFDFNASSGYDHDEISRPDFVYLDEACDKETEQEINSEQEKHYKFSVTNLNSFQIISEINNETGIISFLLKVYKGKTRELFCKLTLSK